jgi:hypothetical protein
MNLLKNKYFQIGLAFTGGILLRNFIMKSVDKKPEVLESLNPPEESHSFSGPSIPPAPSTTPVSGTSDSILHQIDEEQANNLKHELK